jgi:hypothetical protein
MVPQSETRTDSDRSPVLNAIIGGIAGVIFGFVPLSPILGGGIAGYLQDGTGEQGLKVGAGAGVIMLVPFVFMGFLFLSVLGFGGLSSAYGMQFAVAPFAVGFIGLLVLFVSGLYTVGLSTLGGYLGVYVRRELETGSGTD